MAGGVHRLLQPGGRDMTRVRTLSTDELRQRLDASKGLEV